MKGAAVVMGTSAFMLLVCASLYASTLAKEFQGSEIYSAGLFGGKAKIDMDQIRFELGGCIYAAFCISAIGRREIIKKIINCSLFKILVILNQTTPL